MSGRDYLICLAAYGGFGPASLQRLGDFFHRDWSGVFQASPSSLTAAGCGSQAIDRFLAWRSQFVAGQLLDQLEQLQLKTVTWDDDDYPQLLQEIHRPPAVLFYRGRLDCLQQPCLAIIGSRRYSSYGRQAAAALVKPLAANGLSIVSGLAIGLDTLVHEAALDAGGSCIAVPGSGVEAAGLYPKQNRRLAERILAQDGLLLSEFAPGSPILPSNFPRRNRVISGLSLGVLVLEAALRSGSLITARWALEQNREVLALPGNIFQPLSAGCNQLIRQGARPISCAEEVLAALGQEVIKTPTKPALSDLEEGIWLNLSQGPLSADELANLLNQDIRVITSALSKMQLAGLLADYGGGLFGQV